MRIDFALVLAAVVVISVVQAATTEKQTDVDNNQHVALEERRNTNPLDSRDRGGRDADDSEESGSSGRKGGYNDKLYDSDLEGGWKDDENEKEGNKRGGYNKDNDDDWADDKKVEYSSSGSEKHEDIKPYEKNKKNNAYEKHEEVKHYDEKNDKNSYEKKEEPKSQYGKPLQLSGLAEVIPAEQHALTLNQIYRVNKQKDGAYGQHGYNNQQVLVLLKFGRDFESWNPRNNNSQWEFVGTEVGVSADNAAYVVHSGEEDNYGIEKWHGEKENGYNAHKPKKDRSYVVQYSLPYKQYYNSSDPNNVYDYYEGAVQTKNNFSIGPTQRFLARSKLACKIINADKNPFPASAVSNPWNDPRLANCFLQVSGDEGLLFFISVTNTGVWANYGRGQSGNSTALPFISKRLIGRRPRYDTIVDAAIEINRREARLISTPGVCSFYLNGYRAWSIYAIGVPPPDDGVTKIDRGTGDPQIATVSSVKVIFGTGKCLDESDPNNNSNRQRLVRVQGNSTIYYSANDTFYDEENRKSNQLWGQGAILTLLKLLILRAESLILPQKILPGVYGAEAPKYQPVNLYQS